jgi:uncharacterized protein (DUF2141 family)
MKLIILLTISLLFLLRPALHAQSELTISIENLKNSTGKVIVDLLDQHEATVINRSCQIADNTCILVFKDLSPGMYAIQFIHDENGNDELDTNFLGIPKEGFGFSNDAFGRFGPKDFEEWLFPVVGDTTIRMVTRYL